MQWYQYLSLGCLLVCLITCLWHLFRLIRLGKPKDYSKKGGNISKGLVYSCTTAMMPNHKESAYLHLPTYISGMLMHIGIFLSLLLYIVFFFAKPEIFPNWLKWSLFIILIVTKFSGLGLFIKRILSKKLRELSSLDDYISNFLPTLFQFSTAFYLMLGFTFAPYYYIAASVLFLYIPVGKLRHVVYFFAARYHLGYFYGWRNSWPPKMEED